MIDSVSGLEMALASMFREDFRESLYRLVATLTEMGVTVLMTAEVEDRYTELHCSSYGNAFLAAAIVRQRYIELKGRMRRVLSVVMVRGSAHSDEFRFYDIADGGINIGDGLAQYQGILSGKPTLACTRSALSSGLPIFAGRPDGAAP